MSADPADVVRARAAALPQWTVTLHTHNDATAGDQPVAVVRDGVGRESWVFLSYSIGADPSQDAEQVAQMIMDNENWTARSAVL